MTAPGPDEHPDTPGPSIGPTPDDPIDIAASARVDASPDDVAEMVADGSLTDDALRVIAQRAAQFQALGDLVRAEMPPPIADEAWTVGGMDVRAAEEAEVPGPVERDAAIRAALVAGGFATSATSLDAHRRARSDRSAQPDRSAQISGEERSRQTGQARRSRRIVQLAAAAAIIAAAALVVPRLVRTADLSRSDAVSASAPFEGAATDSGVQGGDPEGAPQADASQATGSASEITKDAAVDTSIGQDRSAPSSTSVPGPAISTTAVATTSGVPEQTTASDAYSQMDQSAGHEPAAFAFHLFERVACVVGLSTNTRCG